MSMSSTPGQTGNSGKSMSGSQPGMSPEQQSQIQAQQGFFNDTIAPAMQSNTWSGTPQDMYNQYQNTVLGGTGGKGTSNYNLGPTPNPMLGGMTPADALGGGLAQTNPATGLPFGDTSMLGPTPVFAKGPNYAGKDFGPSDLYGSVQQQQEFTPDMAQVIGAPANQLLDESTRNAFFASPEYKQFQDSFNGPMFGTMDIYDSPYFGFQGSGSIGRRQDDAYRLYEQRLAQQQPPAPPQNNLTDVLSQYQPPAPPPSLVQEIQQPTTPAPAPAPVQQPMAAPAPAPVQQPVARQPQPVARPAPRPALRPAPAPVARPAPRPVQQPVARPVQQPVARPAPRPVQQPVLRQPTPTARSSNMVTAPARQAVPQPAARSVSRVNPPLLPSRPTVRR